jgi:hypothetical protein
VLVAAAVDLAATLICSAVLVVPHRWVEMLPCAAALVALPACALPMVLAPVKVARCVYHLALAPVARVALSASAVVRQPIMLLAMCVFRVVAVWCLALVRRLAVMVGSCKWLVAAAVPAAVTYVLLVVWAPHPVAAWCCAVAVAAAAAMCCLFLAVLPRVGMFLSLVVHLLAVSLALCAYFLAHQVTSVTEYASGQAKALLVMVPECK